MRLPTEDVLAAGPPDGLVGTVIGRSRQGRTLRGHVVGNGSLHISLIAGCHADEPVGPDMLGLLVRFLARLAAEHELLREITWYIIPHLNPDGASRNAAWADRPIAIVDSKARSDLSYHPIV
ncbi:MAG: M14 family zinc carboxypeptidase [Acidobacteriota bacterium]